MTKANCTVCVFLSPSRWIYEWRKNKYPQGSDDRAFFARRWPVRWLFCEAVMAILLCISDCGHWQLNSYLALLLGLIAGGRILEISCAYYIDAISSLKGEEKDTNLTPAERIQLAAKSYLSLLILWAVFYFSLPTEYFAASDPCKPAFDTFVDAIYFSGTTITTLGYGDILPKSNTAKLLCIVEVLSGFIVLVVAVGSYLTGVKDPRKGDGNDVRR